MLNCFWPRRRLIVAGVVVAPSFVFIAFAIALIRLTPPAITVRHVKSVPTGQAMAATFDITNHTSNTYFLCPNLVEACHGAQWKPCFKFSEDYESELRLDSHKSLTFAVTNLPSGSPLRVSLHVFKELRGVRAFPRLLRDRLANKEPLLTPNPFDKSEAITSQVSSIVSDEFMVPEPRGQPPIADTAR